MEYPAREKQSARTAEPPPWPLRADRPGETHPPCPARRLTPQRRKPKLPRLPKRGCYPKTPRLTRSKPNFCRTPSPGTQASGAWREVPRDALAHGGGGPRLTPPRGSCCTFAARNPVGGLARCPRRGVHVGPGGEAGASRGRSASWGPAPVPAKGAGPVAAVYGTTAPLSKRPCHFTRPRSSQTVQVPSGWPWLWNSSVRLRPFSSQVVVEP